MDKRTWQDIEKSALRTDFVVKEVGSVDEGTRVLFRASAPIRDRDGETVDPMGWKWNAVRMPPLLLCHDSSSFESLVGKALSIEKDATGLYYEALLFDKSPTELGEVSRQLAWICREHIDVVTCSVGFRPLKWQDPDGRIFTIDAPGNSYPWSVPGRKYLEQELMELSVVPVPSLIEALALQVRTFGGAFKPKEPERDPIEQIVEIATKAGIPIEVLDHDPAWLKAGIKQPLSRPLVKVGAHLSGADVERMRQARGLIDEILATATPAEVGSTEGT